MSKKRNEYIDWGDILKSREPDKTERIWNMVTYGISIILGAIIVAMMLWAMLMPEPQWN